MIGDKIMTNEELIRAVIAVSVETGSLVCIGCVHEDNCGIHGCAILREAATVLEAQSAQLAAKDAEIERMKMLAERALNHEQYAVKCICDVETYLELGAPKYIKRVIDKWRTPAKQGEEG